MKPHRPLSETMKVGSANIRFPLRCAPSAGSSCGYVAHGAVVRLKVIVKISGDLLEISLNRLLSIGGGYARAWNCQGRGDRKASRNAPYPIVRAMQHPPRGLSVSLAPPF